VPENDRPSVDSEAGTRFVVDYQAGNHGPETAVSCPKCGKDLGGVLPQAREELLCTACGIVYDVTVRQEGASVREVRRVPIIEDTGLPSPGEILNRPDLEVDIGWKRRLIMLLWAFLMALLMLGGVFAVIAWLS